MRLRAIAVSTCVVVLSAFLPAAASVLDPDLDGLTEMPSPDGVVAPGEVREIPFVVPEAKMLYVLAAAEPDLRFTLRSPAGVMHSAANAGRIPGFFHEHFVEDKAADVFQFDNPPRGEWILRVDASQCAESREFATVLMVDTPFRVQVKPEGGGRVKMGEPVPAVVWVERDGAIVKGTTWKCDLVLYGKHIKSIAVFDDGRHGDGQPHDGVFGATIATGPTKGHHEIQVDATLPAALGGGTISSLGEFESWTVEDLLTLPGSVSLSQKSVRGDDRVNILATIANRGATAVPKLEVQFLEGAKKLGSVFVDLAAGETCQVELPWTVTGPESHQIKVVVSTSRLDEIDLRNNSSTTTFELDRPLPRREGATDRACHQIGSALTGPSTR